MNLYPLQIVPLLSMLLSLALLVYGVGLNYKNPINRSFGLLAFLIFLSQCQQYVYWSQYSLIAPNFWVRIFPLFDFLLGIAALNFVYRLINKKNDLFFYLAFIPNILAFILMFSSDLIQSGYRIIPWGIKGEWGPLFVLFFTINVIIVGGWGLALVYLTYLKNPSQVLKKQLLTITFGGVIAFGASYFLIFVLRYLFKLDRIPDFSNNAGVIFLVFAFLAIVRYRFLSLNLTSVAHDLFLHVNDGIIILNHNQKIIHYNQSAAKILSIIAPLDEDTLLCNIFPELRFEDVFIDRAYTFNNRSLLISNYFLFEQKEFKGSIVFIRDVTEIKKAEEERLEMQKQLVHTNQLSSIGVLASGVAHELNNPLTAVLGFVRHIKKHLNVSDEVITKLNKVENASVRMAKIIDQLRKISRDASTDQQKEFSLYKIIDEAALLLKKQLEINNIDLCIEIDPSLIILANEIQLESIFQNLISNSKDAFENLKFDDKVIKILGYQKDDLIIVDYFDNAGGFSDEVANSIFLPFFTTKEVGKGTGLGMTLVKEILEEHNASIDIIDHKKGGVHFRIYFPVL